MVLGALASFVLLYACALDWYVEGLFTGDRWDLFFDADVDKSLKSFGLGGRYAYTHPLIELVKVPVRGLGLVVSKLFGLPGPETAQRFALAVSPAAQALTLVVLHLTLVAGGLRPRFAALGTLFFATWFTNVVFGIIPETFGPSCLAFAVLFYFLVADVSDRVREAGLWLAGITIVGITITNAAPLGLVLGFRRARTTPFVRAFLIEGLRLGAIVAICLGLFALEINLLDKTLHQDGGEKFIRDYLVLTPGGMAANLSNLIAQFFSMVVGVGTWEIPRGEWLYGALAGQPRSGVSLQRGFDLTGVLYIAAGAAVLAAIVRPLWGRKWTVAEQAAVAVIGFNVVFHTIFGHETFLYTQHWALPFVFLLAPSIERYPKLVAVAALVALATSVAFVLNLESFLPVYFEQPYDPWNDPFYFDPNL